MSTNRTALVIGATGGVGVPLHHHPRRLRLDEQIGENHQQALVLEHAGSLPQPGQALNTAIYPRQC